MRTLSVSEWHCLAGRTSVIKYDMTICIDYGRDSVRAPNFATKNIGEKYPTLCPLNFRYDPKISVEDLHEFSSALYSLVRFKVTSKQYKILYPWIMSHFLPTVVPDIPRLTLLQILLLNLRPGPSPLTS